MTMRCGFIGLGDMGGALAGNLAPKGLPTTVYDRSAAAIEALVETGARPARSVREVAQESDVVGICVPADADVRDVLCGDDGIFAHAGPATIVAIHSTVLPETVLAMAAEGEAKGIPVLEVPVAGGAVRAAAGDAFYMVSGDEEVLGRARPYLEAAAGQIIYAGEFGNAAKLKLALNVVTNLSLAAAREGLSLARAMGLPQELFEEAGQANTMLNAIHLQYLSVRKLPDEMVASPDLQHVLRGRMEIAQKDLGHALTMAREHGVSLPMTGLAAQLLASIYHVDDDGSR